MHVKEQSVNVSSDKKLNRKDKEKFKKKRNVKIDLEHKENKLPRCSRLYSSLIATNAMNIHILLWDCRSVCVPFLLLKTLMVAQVIKYNLVMAIS